MGGAIRRGTQYDEAGVAQDSANVRVLAAVEAAGAKGANEQQVMADTGMSRGSASSSLNLLHSRGEIHRLDLPREVGARRKQGVFVTDAHLAGRAIQVHRPLDKRLDEYLERLAARIDHNIESGTKWGIGTVPVVIEIIEKAKPYISRPSLSPGSNPHRVISLMKSDHPLNATPARGWSRHDVVESLSLSESTASSILSQLHETGLLERLVADKTAGERFGRYVLVEQARGRRTEPHQRQSTNSELAGIKFCELLIEQVAFLKHGNNVLTTKLMATTPDLIEKAKA